MFEVRSLRLQNVVVTNMSHFISASPCTLASALGVAAANDTILLNAGTYIDTIDLSMPLTLQAAPPHVLDGSVILTGGVTVACPKSEVLRPEPVLARVALVGLSFVGQGIVLQSINYCQLSVIFCSLSGMKGTPALTVQGDSRCCAFFGPFLLTLFQIRACSTRCRMC
jgi:hypothetical protein